MQTGLSIKSRFQKLTLVLHNRHGVALHFFQVWHDSVRKLRVMDADGTELGTLYCDLFRRSNKNNHASHYTLQSGRARGSDNSGPQRPIVALVRIA